MEVLKEVGNDGIVDGFEVNEDFEVKYDSDTLPKVDAEALDLVFSIMKEYADKITVLK